MKAARMILCLGALVLSGCGEATSADKLQGTWVAELPDGCGLGLTFDDGDGILQTICPLMNGAIGDEIVRGPFTATADTITISPTRTSCPAKFNASPFRMGYAFAGESLGLKGATTVTFFTRDDSTGGVPPTIQFGCWSDDRSQITPGPVVDL